MKLLIVLNSKFYTDTQNQYCYDNKIEIEWPLPVLPRTGELFDCDSIIETMPEFDKGNLAWIIDFVDYEKIEGHIIPIIWIKGE